MEGFAAIFPNQFWCPVATNFNSEKPEVSTQVSVAVEGAQPGKARCPECCCFWLLRGVSEAVDFSGPRHRKLHNFKA